MMSLIVPRLNWSQYIHHSKLCNLSYPIANWTALIHFFKSRHNYHIIISANTSNKSCLRLPFPTLNFHINLSECMFTYFRAGVLQDHSHIWFRCIHAFIKIKIFHAFIKNSRSPQFPWAKFIGSWNNILFLKMSHQETCELQDILPFLGNSVGCFAIYCYKMSSLFLCFFGREHILLNHFEYII